MKLSFSTLRSDFGMRPQGCKESKCANKSGQSEAGLEGLAASMQSLGINAQPVPAASSAVDRDLDARNATQEAGMLQAPAAVAGDSVHRSCSTATGTTSAFMHMKQSDGAAALGGKLPGTAWVQLDQDGTLSDAAYQRVKAAQMLDSATG